MENEHGYYSFNTYLKKTKRIPLSQRYTDFVISRDEYLKVLENEKEEREKEDDERLGK